MRATIWIPIAVLVAAGAATAVGVSMTSNAEDAPVGPIVVHAPQQPPTGAPAAPVPVPPAPLHTAESLAPPPPQRADVPAPPPPVTNGNGDDDWDDDWDDDGGDDDGWDD